MRDETVGGTMARVSRILNKKGIKQTSKKTKHTGPTPQPGFLQKEDKERATLGKGKSIQDAVDRILSIPGTPKEWIARLVENGMDSAEATRRVNQALWWYRKGLIVKKLPHGREQLVRVKG